MSALGFSALAGAWLFALLIPLILFYFLKLKRPRMDVGSLALWRQVLNDQRVNSPFQKFKRNILLLLQVLLLTLLVLAAMQPFIVANPEQARNVAVLIDCSASMAAVEKPGGPTRLDLARQRVAELIDNLLPGQQLSLIEFNSKARRLTDFTDNKRILTDALNKIQVVDVPSRLEIALRMTQAMARTEATGIENVLMFTDGNVPEEVAFELPFKLSYQKLPAAGQNMGITEINARRSATEAWDVFVRVEASGAAQMAGNVELLQSGQKIDSQHVVLEKGTSQRLQFRVRSEVETPLEVHLAPDDFDSLPSDNLAFLTLPRARPLVVYVQKELTIYRHAIKSLKGITLVPGDEETDASPPAVCDLVISNSPEDARVEAPLSLFDGVIPEPVKPLLVQRTGAAEVIDWDRSSPLLQHVELTDVVSTEELAKNDEVQDADFEELGYEILVDGRSGPLLLQKREGARVFVYLLTHSERSTLPYRVAFPIFVANLVQTAMQQSSLSEIRGLTTGVLPPLPMRAETEYEVRGPSGAVGARTTGADGLLTGIEVLRVGQYDVQGGGGQSKRVGAALLDSRETSLVGAEQLKFPEDLKVAAADELIKSDRPLWPILAFAGMWLLLVEWWFFQHRPGGFAVQKTART